MYKGHGKTHESLRAAAARAELAFTKALIEDPGLLALLLKSHDLNPDMEELHQAWIKGRITFSQFLAAFEEYVHENAL